MTPTQIYSAASAMLLMLVAPLTANAHLMVEQRGTINIVDDGAFVVVSVPVAAFSGVDDDGDGLVSAAELRSHYRHISRFAFDLCRWGGPIQFRELPVQLQLL